MMSLYDSFSRVEGIVSIQPNPYQFIMVIGNLYSWDEIIPKLKAMLNNANEIRIKSVAPNKEMGL
jgi:hypothetical protein